MKNFIKIVAILNLLTACQMDPEPTGTEKGVWRPCSP